MSEVPVSYVVEWISEKHIRSPLDDTYDLRLYSCVQHIHIYNGFERDSARKKMEQNSIVFVAHGTQDKECGSIIQ